MMLDNMPVINGDPLWALLGRFRADQRKNKIDLLVGVYRDEYGNTPVMKTVQDAEIHLAHQAHSKAYGMLSGNANFNQQMAKFVLGDSPSLNNQCTIQTVGASGALRLIADLIATLSPDSTVWISDPGYINHRPLMEGAGLAVNTYPWQNKNGHLDIDACFAALEKAKEGDVLLLHACCHNPTGIDPSLEQWQLFSDKCKQKNIVPFIDMAYQGFGDDPDTDAAGLRLMIEDADFAFIAASCSKNMGLYNERTGIATVVTTNHDRHADIQTLLETITRANYSMPPNHGAAVASYLLDKPDAWLVELASYRSRVDTIRQALGAALQDRGAPAEFLDISQQKGMFSLLPLTKNQMLILQDEFAIYGMPNGRINIAGLKMTEIPQLADAIMSIISR